MSKLEIAEQIGTSIIIMVLGIVLWYALKRIGLWYDRLHSPKVKLPTYAIAPYEGEKEFYEGVRAITSKEEMNILYGEHSAFQSYLYKAYMAILNNYTFELTGDIEYMPNELDIELHIESNTFIIHEKCINDED